MQEYFDFLKADCMHVFEQRGNISGAVSPLEENVISKKKRFLAITHCKGLFPETNNVAQFDQVKLECLGKLSMAFVEKNFKVPARLTSARFCGKRYRTDPDDLETSGGEAGARKPKSCCTCNCTPIFSKRGYTWVTDDEDQHEHQRRVP
ncbi:hypothetical protein RvY_11290 [Ramazzottius varieornatus]|uniref:Uncharacterized protein n=1 Tax=Ramazzottius varieornatus TaxID=947166 RepID=A0A1D1VJZ9_RAMVA|nr:hypothetical protein RvY_11290 [Ramazzottius varieornatus]